MNEPWVKWRRLPGTRRLHLLTWDATGDRRKYTSTCGRVFLTSEVVDDPKVPRCKSCVRRAEPEVASGS